ncbi:endonuclease/exonuclease/phosphatase family protein [Actinophytocola sp.]|uniref:endonuclease/exonuclease/phosphatase family protein n=1 Tax=Actinophytocola sp. TaxID=1872138 RepID=UPI003D6A029B
MSRVGESRVRWWTRGGSALVVAALLVPGDAVPSAKAVEPEPVQNAASVTLRVVTYNIHHGQPCCAGVGENEPDIERTGRTLDAMDPDIVLLQETNLNHPEGNCRNQPGRLAEILGMNHVMGHNRIAGTGCGTSATGNAILSRYPLEYLDNTPLPRGDGETAACPNTKAGGAQRCLLSARVTVPGGPSLVVYTTHLEHQDTELRQRQARTMLDAIGSAGGRKLLGGDFNHEPDGTIHGWVTDFGFSDAWEKRHGVRSCGATNGCTYRADDPDRRIDYIYVSSPFAVSGGAVRDAPIASDHRPLRMTLTVSR